MQCGGKNVNNLVYLKNTCKNHSLNVFQNKIKHNYEFNLRSKEIYVYFLKMYYRKHISDENISTIPNI